MNDQIQRLTRAVEALETAYGVVGSSDSSGESAAVLAYDSYLADNVEPFVQVCSKLGDSFVQLV